MNLGRITNQPCSNTPPPPDARCNDPVFALLNPNVCGVSSQLIIKPEVSLCCQLGSVQFKAFIVSNGQEKDVTNQTVFTTSNPDVAVVGSSSGNATGLTDGEAVITASYTGLTASASLSVLGGVNCCADIAVGIMVVIDISKSMTQAFGGSYSQKIDFAKAAAKQFINSVNTQKDLVGLAVFYDTGYTVLSAPISNAASVSALVDTITTAGQLTGYKVAANSAIASLGSVSVDQKVLMLLTDGEDSSATANDASDALAALAAFKSSGGVVLCLGVRATGTAFSLLETFSTGGFFVNSYNGVDTDALRAINGLRGYLCAGNCAPVGDDFEAKGKLDYCKFKNWNVISGHVDLIGNGFLDFLPGNGLYVELAGSSAPHNGIMESKNSFALTKGHSYRLSLVLAGNQRAAGTSSTVNMRIFGRNNDGIPNPDVAPVLTVNESGTPLVGTPTYKYVYTYVNANGETASSPVSSATPTTANASITVQATASASATAINIYRTTGESPDSAYYLIATIAPTAPAYVDHMSETDMLAAFLVGTIDACSVAPSENTTGSQVNYLNQSVTINDYQQPFQPQSFTFTAPDNISVWIRFQQTSASSGAASAGALLDNVSFDDTTNIINILSDGFSTENVVYVPPACGIGTTYVQTGYGSEGALIPAMTDDTTPSGIASASSTNNSYYPFQAFDDQDGPDPTATFWATGEDVPQWLAYEFDSPKVVGSYLMRASYIDPQLIPTDWLFQGSNNGTDWTTVDSRTGVVFTGTEAADALTFNVASPQAFTNYRIYITKTTSTGFIGVAVSKLQMFGAGAVFSYISGYNCYGTGCLDTPPPVQLPDPNPLPNIEVPGYTPPKQYASTQQACVQCPNGGTQVLADEGALPSFTQNSAADGTYFNFATPPILNIICWTFTSVDNFTLSVNGSNDGITWQKIFLTSDRGYPANPNGDVDMTVKLANCCTFDPAQFKYFKLVYDKTKATFVRASFGGVIFAPSPTLCKSATATSLVSQADADAKALAAATALANAAIQCINSYSATEAYTANCPVGQTGQSVTKSVTYISLISQQDAQTQALAQATAQANAALSCSCTDTSAGQITINDNSAATPYPAVKCVSGLTGHITKVTATISGFQHQFPTDVSIMLMSPDGVLVNLMRNCGGSINVTGINLVFDDAAGSSLNGSSMASGTFKPTQIGPFFPFPLPCPSGAPNNTLAAFNGGNPNGAWTLWVQDTKALSIGKIVGGFTLNITSA